jgi:voltage-dependent potassium channel beta subunit
MEYRSLGSSGLKVSALSFGTWVTFGNQASEDTNYDCMKIAYDNGVNFFDTAEEYEAGKAESVLGGLLKRFGWKRSDMVISTKIFWGGRGPNDCGLSRKHIIEGTDASLARLQLEYVDLIYCHRPDVHTPIEETVRAMNHIIQQGKAFYWGTSEWSFGQIMEAYRIAKQEHLIPPTMEQPEYNMFCRHKVEQEFLPLYRGIGLGTTVFSPLASGLLTGKYNNYMPENTRASLAGYEWLRPHFTSNEGKTRIKKVRKLLPVAEELGVRLPQLALAWCLKNPHVSSVITGGSKPEQVLQNMKTMDILSKLTDDIMKHIDTILANKPKPAQDFR